MQKVVVLINARPSYSSGVRWETPKSGKWALHLALGVPISWRSPLLSGNPPHLGGNSPSLAYDPLISGSTPPFPQAHSCLGNFMSLALSLSTGFCTQFRTFDSGCRVPILSELWIWCSRQCDDLGREITNGRRMSFQHVVSSWWRCVWTEYVSQHSA